MLAAVGGRVSHALIGSEMPVEMAVLFGTALFGSVEAATAGVALVRVCVVQ